MNSTLLIWVLRLVLCLADCRLVKCHLVNRRSIHWRQHYRKYQQQQHHNQYYNNATTNATTTTQPILQQHNQYYNNTYNTTSNPNLGISSKPNDFILFVSDRISNPSTRCAVAWRTARARGPPTDLPQQLFRTSWTEAETVSFRFGFCAIKLRVSPARQD